MTKIDRAVILAAGRGTRMREMTNDVPKPMIEVRGKPVLQHIVQGLRNAGVRKFLIIVGYHAEAVRNFFGDGRSHNVAIEYATQTVQEKIPHCFGVIANDNQKFAHTRIAQSLYNMLQNRLTPHFDHRLWNVISHLAHAGAAPGCEYDCSIDLGHLDAQFSARSNGGELL